MSETAWIIACYFVVAFIAIGFAWQRVEANREEWGAATMFGLFWPISLLLAIGVIIYKTYELFSDE